MEYAIGYARDGYPMLATASATIDAVSGLFRDHWPTSAEIYLDGGVPAPGARFTNKPLADCYTRILDEAEAAGPGREAQIEAARRAWYEGFVAEAIDAYLGVAEVMDITGERHRGLLTGQDMASWRSSAEAPATLEFGGLTVCKTGPWGQGPVFLQQLALLRGFDLAAMGAGSTDLVHTVTECAKLAFADREAWYGDPRQSSVPLEELLSAGYADQRRALVGPEASADLRPGAPAGVMPGLPGYALAGFPVADPALGFFRPDGRTLARAGGGGLGDPTLGGTLPAARPRPAAARPPVAARPSSARATPATWTSRTGSATWSRPPRAAAGCRAPRSSPGSGSASAAAPRCSRSPRASPAHWPRAGARGPRCHRAWRCAAASRTWPSARPAGTSRTSGRWGSS